MMERFSEADDGRVVRDVQGRRGRLEFPLIDPGSATLDEGILWYFDGTPSWWAYVKPADVELSE